MLGAFSDCSGFTRQLVLTVSRFGRIRRMFLFCIHKAGAWTFPDLQGYLLDAASWAHASSHLRDAVPRTSKASELSVVSSARRLALNISCSSRAGFPTHSRVALTNL